MNRITKIYLTLLLTIFMGLSIFSCTKEIMENCEVSINFVYDYNIISANAFENQADEVMLYVFGDDGILLQQFTNGSTVVTNDFKMQLKDLTAGNYYFVAWAQSSRLSANQSYFTIPSLTIGVSSINELMYVLKRESGIQRHELNNLLVGATKAEINYSKAKTSVTINFKKVTNKIRVVILPYTPDGTLDVADYEFSIIDKIGNGRINYDYTLLPDEQITYLPYYAANLTPSNDEILLPEEIDKAAVVEINTSRLMEANAPRLRIVEKNEGKEIVSLNLPWIFSLTEMEDHHEWSLQEYLDRQDRYTITLFFNDSTWMSGTIIINGWVINKTEINF